MSKNPSQDGKQSMDEDSLKLFPERSGSQARIGVFNSVLFGDRQKQKLQCEKNIAQAIETAPMVKLMLAALKSQGCEIDYGRHLTCEHCSPDVTGGYDPKANQLVVCYNRCTKATTQGVLAHELLHMYDFCRANLDFDNLEHIACTEIRAANLMHCSITSGMFHSSVSLFNLKKAHQKCVKQKAVASVLAVRPQMDKRKAWNLVDKVFDKCYNDLEPIGRRVRRNSDDQERAYRERFIYGYY